MLAQSDFERAKKLLATKVSSKEEFDTKREELDVANAQVKQTLENVIFAVVAVALIVLVFFMKRSVAAKEPHVAAE